jgi:hypothetical protein
MMKVIKYEQFRAAFKQDGETDPRFQDNSLPSDTALTQMWNAMTSEQKILAVTIAYVLDNNFEGYEDVH